MSQGVEWAAHVCTILALTPQRRALTGAQLAEFYDLPRPYLRKHLGQLTSARILVATPGPAGGYALARSADAITLIDIVDAIEGRGFAFHCSEIRQRGPSALDSKCYRTRCGIARAMWAAEAAWRSALAKVTVADLVATARREVPKMQRDRTRAWLADSLDSPTRSRSGHS